MNDQSQRITKLLRASPLVDLTEASAGDLAIQLNQEFRRLPEFTVHTPRTKGTRNPRNKLWIPGQSVRYTRTDILADTLEPGILIRCLEEEFGPFLYANSPKIALLRNGFESSTEGFYVSQKSRDLPEYVRVFLLKAEERAPEIGEQERAYSCLNLGDLVPVMA